jgi:hypothetical protein
MKSTRSLFDIILDLDCLISEAKEYLKENPDAIDAGYFKEQIPIWEKQVEYFGSVQDLEGRGE